MGSETSAHLLSPHAHQDGLLLSVAFPVMSVITHSRVSFHPRMMVCTGGSLVQIGGGLSISLISTAENSTFCFPSCYLILTYFTLMFFFSLHFDT